MKKKYLLLPVFLLPLTLNLASCNSKKTPSSSASTGSSWKLDEDTRKFLDLFIYSQDAGPDGIEANLRVEHMGSSDDTITITGLRSNTTQSTANVVIPNEVRGFKVVGIAKEAFSYSKTLETISIPANVEKIGDSAFKNTSLLREVTIASGSKLSYVGKDAFGARTEKKGENDQVEVTYSNSFYQNIYEGTSDYYLGDVLVRAGASASSLKDTTKVICYNAYQGRTISALTFPSGLKQVGASALAGTGLSEVILPDSVVAVEEKAFANMEALTKVKMPNNLDFAYSTSTSYFAGSTNINDLSYDGGASLKVLFDGDKNFAQPLNKVTISPNAEGTVIKDALVGVTDLKNLTLLNGVKVVEKGALPTSLASLESLVVNDDLEYIEGKTLEDSAYYAGLANGPIVLGKCLYGIKGTAPSSVSLTGILGIADEAIKNSVSIAKLDTDLHYVGDKALQGNTGLTEIKLNNAINLGEKAFSGCTNLASITVNPQAKLGNLVFEGCINATDLNFNISKSLDKIFGPTLPHIEHLIIPEGVTRINAGTFKDLTSLVSVTFPSTLLEIGDRAFYGCTSLQKLYFPESVSDIGSFAFAYCSSLTEVLFQETISTYLDPIGNPYSTYKLNLGSFCFAYCTNLANAEHKGEFTIVNRARNIGGAILYGTKISQIRIELERRFLQDLSISRFDPLNDANTIKYSPSWNLTDTKDSFGNQKTIPYYTVECNFQMPAA